MKITIIEQAPDLGGSEYYMLNLVSEWVTSGHQVCLYSNHDNFRYLASNNGATTYNLPFILDITGNLRGFIKSLLIAPYACYWYKNLIRTLSSTDILLMSGYAEKILVSLLVSRNSFPIFWLEYPPVSHLLRRNKKVPNILYKIAVQKVNKVITISQKTSLDLIEQLHIDPKKVSCIYPGVKLPTKKEKQIALRQAQKFKVTHNLLGKKIIGNISRLAPEKGQEKLIELIGALKNKDPAFVGILVGQGPDEARLKLIVKQKKMEKSILITGFLPNRYQAYSLFDVFFFTSNWLLEGFGMVLAEAMSMGIPIIAYENQLNREILKNGRAGFLVDPKEMKSLIIAVQKCFDNSQEMAEKIKFANELVRHDFNLKVQANKLLLQFKELG
jgi:glycosyltransferase involved in cell wall biosynthesis